MNRIFHARIAWYQYFLLVVLTVNAVGALWCKYILPAVLLMLLLIVVIEQIIHTVYTVSTDGVLEISTGRFMRKSNSYCRNHSYPEVSFHEIRKVFGDELCLDRVWKRKVCFGDACQGT